MIGAKNIQTLMSLPHKEGVDKQDWGRCHSNLLKLAYFYVEFAQLRGLPILFTSIIRGRIPGISKSDSHGEGRAFDASVRGWPKESQDELEKEMAEIFSSIGAISATTGRPRPVLIHTGTAPHFHCQVRR